MIITGWQVLGVVGATILVEVIILVGLGIWVHNNVPHDMFYE